MFMDKSRTPNEEALDFVSKFNEIYFQTFTHHLSSFVTDDPVPIKLPSMPDIVMTPVDQTVIPENSWKKDKQKACVTDDKQIKNQSTKAKPDKILVELKLWGNAIKCSVKRQHKYQTLRVKIALSSFALPQFNKYWTTDLGGIPKAQSKPKAKNTLNTKKSGVDAPEYSEKGKEVLEEKGNNKDNKAVLAEILTLLQKLV
ncbi:hypothetical protein RhiirA5_427028 [Rhizophagus irregularis]|uniref:Uncharacterized protein n=1 Tax=Rhizophagus irregularis TaxID=588596 RepID=A0A2N0P334_9GLOM|nr:hypothetical protein RhiirA5_427028 [Rhizophagus irregularis]